MPEIRKFLFVVCTVAFLSFGVFGCSGSPTEPSGEEHGPEGGGGESGESGTRYMLSETATEVRSGVDLIVDYDSTREVFSGTVRNTTSATVTQVRVEIHLSNGVELGPTPRVDLPAGETHSVELDARGQTFSWLSAVARKSVILGGTSTTTCRGCMSEHRRQEPIWTSVRGAGVKAVSPAERGRSEATRLDVGEHTRTLLA